MTDQQRTPGEEHSTTDRAKEKAREMKDRAQSTAESVASEAQERGRDAMEEGKEKAREMGDRAEQKARSRAEEQKGRVADGIRSVADALRQGTRELPEDRQQYGRFLETVADRVDGVSGYLDDRNVDDITRDARRFARDHTAAFLGGAFTLGVAGARFLKSSGSQEPAHELEGSAPYAPSRRPDEHSGGRTDETRITEPGVGAASRPTGPASRPGGVAETRGVNEPGGLAGPGRSTEPYPRESTAREASERIQEEGGYA